MPGDASISDFPRAMTASRVDKLREQKRALVAYLESKLAAEDWHACQDAASDIREIEAMLKVLSA